jgi:hypothetical protein
VAHARHAMRHFASPGLFRRGVPFALAIGMEPLSWMCTLISRFLWVAQWRHSCCGQQARSDVPNERLRVQISSAS